MSWRYFIEETLSTGEKVTVPFDTEEEMNNYIKEQENKENKDDKDDKDDKVEVHPVFQKIFRDLGIVNAKKEQKDAK